MQAFLGLVRHLWHFSGSRPAWADLIASQGCPLRSIPSRVRGETGSTNAPFFSQVVGSESTGVVSEMPMDHI